ncbi:hypothetical protein JCM10908_003709 [Rhodotorula pacifica]|uniref:MFS transporter n=1 Tax=Rhodotorula pacifica TaxID=1495444 RepID=UPI003171D4E2
MLARLRTLCGSARTPDGAEDSASKQKKYQRAPLFLRIRSSTWFIGLAVGFGVLVDLSSYSLAVPVIPFRLQALGYDDIGGKTGWLVSAYAGGLIVSSPIVAIIGAKYKNRQIPLFLGLLFMAAAVVLFMEAKTYALMVVARILQGFSGTVLWTIGLALITDSVPEERVGTVLGAVMIGFSCGQAIGPPVGGVLYARMGYRAPFVFSLILVGVDLILRLFIIEKHNALKYIRAGHYIPNFEAPGYVDRTKTMDSEKTVAVPDPALKPTDPSTAPLNVGPTNTVDSQKTVAVSDPALKATDPSVAPSSSPLPTPPPHENESRSELKSKIPSHWLGLWHMLKSPRAMTTMALTLLNGFIVGALQDTGMTLYLEEEYHLTSFGAGLVFLGFVVPTFFASPLAGWLVDRWGTKWIMVFGTALCIPMYPLLIIKGPLALFIFFLAVIGIGVSAFITPTTVDLALVAAHTPSITTAHVFSLFNLAFSVGSLIGPIVGGQIISKIGILKGWTAIAILSSALTLLLLPPITIWVGGPLAWRRKDSSNIDPEADPEEKPAEEPGPTQT